jgi:para-nitrobenzyl esterase
MDYSHTYAKRVQNDVPFIAGNNLDESGAVPETAFADLRNQASNNRPGAGSPHPNVTLADFLSAAKRKFGPMVDEFLKLYPASTDQEAALANNAAVRDNSRVSTFLWATEWSKGAKGPVYTYFWTHAPPGPDHDRRGAYHGSEISYVFNNVHTTDLPWTDDDRKIADLMSSYWASFAANGNPNGKGRPFWPPFDSKVATVMEVGDHFGPIPVAAAARLDFWKRFFATQDAW